MVVYEELSVPQFGNVGLDDLEIVGLGNIGRPGFQNDLTIAIVLHGQRFLLGGDAAGESDGLTDQPILLH
jgi:hypothetical protein